ncbi:MAG: sodium/substrate symporter small subunit [Burkholderiaceae bacterium]
MWTAQGALVGFWLLVLVYAWGMRQLDRRFDMLERQASDGAENAPERPGRSR